MLSDRIFTSIISTIFISLSIYGICAADKNVPIFQYVMYGIFIALGIVGYILSWWGFRKNKK